ncbi:hypothetical protein AB1Y20_005292 [Prymnesium parvum]|uniref:Fe2OG dioxygenase domain-containing protein n=1 Tax=Prymnesium parvum TaxID=97485 RepID=A0AB34J6T4_PRYPA
MAAAVAALCLATAAAAPPRILRPAPPSARRAAPSARESWQEHDSSTVYGRARSASRDAGESAADDYSTLDVHVSARAAAAVSSRRAALALAPPASEPSAAPLVARAEAALSARRGAEAERLFVDALARDRRCAAAWYGLAALLHEHQHGGLRDDAAASGGAARERLLAEATDFALVAARLEPAEPRALALLGDVLNDRGEHREACRAWRAAEERGRARWRAIAAGQPAGAFGPRAPLRALRVGESVALRRASGRPFVACRLAARPPVYVLEGFSTEEERAAIVEAAEAAPLRAVPLSEGGDDHDDRRGCEVAWLSSPCTSPASAWASLMLDAADVVLPRCGALPGAAEAEDLHVVRYAPGGSYGLHLDATFAVPRAVTVLHYLNDVPPDPERGEGFGGETWLPHAVASQSAETGGADNGRLTPGCDGVLVPPRAGDALVFFSFNEHGEVEPASLHAGRPASALKLVANQWIRLELSDRRGLVPRGPGFGPRVVS